MLCVNKQQAFFSDSPSKLQKIQNSAARIITESKYDTPVQPLPNELNWKSIREPIRYDIAVMIFKCLNSPAPDYLSIFETLEDLHPVEHRNTKIDLRSPMLVTTTCDNKKVFPIMQLWSGIALMRIKIEHPHCNLLNPCFKIKHGLQGAL